MGTCWSVAPRATSDERWLFLIHVDWRWIRQRPHWLAEEAHKNGKVLVAYRLHPRRLALPKNPSEVARFPMLPLPLGSIADRPLMARLMLCCQQAWIAAATLCFRPTHVYISHPKVFGALPRMVSRRAAIVYDCMDDAVAMASVGQREAILEQERELVSAADLVVASSRVLVARLLQRFGVAVEGKLRLVQNGVNTAQFVSAREPKRARTGSDVVIGYTGTVARWFDFDSVIAALEMCEGASIRVIGPRTGLEPDHERIQYVPPVNHDELPALLSDCSALIMPFKADPLVSAVNPVKLYEYLQYGVPVIASRYDEIESEFGEFVEFYETPNDLAELFQRLLVGKLRTRAKPAAVEAFLRESSWSRRWRQVRESEEVELSG